MKRVITYGTFDLLHYGHISLLRRAKELGDYLIVAVQDGDYILKYKPDTKILYSTEQRIELVKALRVVDEVIMYKNVDETIKEFGLEIENEKRMLEKERRSLEAEKRKRNNNA